MAVQLDVEFEVEDGNVNQYRTLISYMRLMLAASFIHRIPALRPLEDIPTQFELILRTNNRSVTLRFRMDNLYLLGYRMENGQWLEFDNIAGGTHLITEPGTQFLGFNGSYIRLQGAARMSIDNITIGFHALVNAIHQLAKREEGEARARSLMTVIFMFAEAIRLTDVQSFVAENYYGGARIGNSLIPHIHAWGQFSKAIFFMDFYPHGVNGWSMPQIRDKLDIALYSSRQPPGRRMVAGAKDEQSSIGLPLLEVFSVRIFNNKGDTRQIYGTITVTDTLRTQLIYNRTRGNPEYTNPDLDLSLTGPSEAVSALGDVNIKFLLYDRARNDEIILDEVFNWNFYNFGNEYDRVLREEFDIDGGSLIINYAVFINAVAAKLRIQKSGGGENESEVYGRVSSSTLGAVGDARTLLFNRERADCVSVSGGDLIPLSRSVAAVPLSSAFEVTAELYDSNSISDQELTYYCSISFDPKTSGTDFTNMYGEDSDTTVIVDWVRSF